MLAWWFDDRCDEVRSYERVASEKAPCESKNRQVALRWQPPASGSNYRKWGEEKRRPDPPPC